MFRIISRSGSKDGFEAIQVSERVGQVRVPWSAHLHMKAVSPQPQTRTFSGWSDSAVCSQLGSTYVPAGARPASRSAVESSGEYPERPATLLALANGTPSIKGL